MEIDFIKSNRSFYVAGYEYDYTHVYLFLNKPIKDIDEEGSSYYRVDKSKFDISTNIGMKIPIEISNFLGFPNFDGSFSIIKIDENINSYLEKHNFKINDNLKIELL